MKPKNRKYKVIVVGDKEANESAWIPKNSITINLPRE